MDAPQLYLFIKKRRGVQKNKTFFYRYKTLCMYWVSQNQLYSQVVVLISDGSALSAAHVWPEIGKELVYIDIDGT